MLNKLNCWEFLRCGCEKTGECPAVVRNAGKLCWMVTGTLCGGQLQGTFAEKVNYCRKCDYFSYMSQ